MSSVLTPLPTTFFHVVSQHHFTHKLVRADRELSLTCSTHTFSDGKHGPADWALLEHADGTVKTLYFANSLKELSEKLNDPDTHLYHTDLLEALDSFAASL